MKIEEVLKLEDGTEVYTDQHHFVKIGNNLYHANTKTNIMMLYSLKALLEEDFKIKKGITFEELPYNEPITVIDTEVGIRYEGIKVCVFGEPLLVIKLTHDDRLESFDAHELEQITYLRYEV